MGSSFLERIPHDVLQHIAFAGAAPGCALPVDLCSLLSTCRAVYNGLNILSTPHLYAAIFKLKYRNTVVSGQHTDSSLAAELVRRCGALRRCQRLDISLPHLRQDLWTLLWMAAEEGSCVPLSEARFPRFAVELARYYLRADVPSAGDIKPLAVWLLCLGLSREDILAENPDSRSTLVALLRPFVSTSESKSRAPYFTSRLPSTVVFHPGPASGQYLSASTGQALMRYNVPTCSPHLPSPSDAAIILIFALKEAMSLQIPYHLPATRAIALAENRSGPTAEDYTAFQRAVTPLFSDMRMSSTSAAATTLKFTGSDPRISEILAVPEFYPERGYLEGSLTGVWEGSMMISRVSLGDSTPEEDIQSDFLCRTHMQCEFLEHYLPSALDLQELPCGESADPKFILSEDLQHESVRPALDHVLVGQTLRDHEDAWGSSGFTFAGTVHDDGQIIFTRRPKNDESEISEAWIFQGRLHYNTAFVGTFRSSSDDSCGVQGIFSLSKRAALARGVQ
ncbi:hypothetical protein K438DRAFT_1829680 [Mycena galopus ATCC 62051]|nr:hypothetical protein K438DRAFT_1829680 [Mycena galopus ATCC 62051]